MEYEVINKFKDTDGHVYEVGKPYPKDGKGTKKRLDELSKVHPKYKVAFIKQKEPPANNKTKKE